MHTAGPEADNARTGLSVTSRCVKLKDLHARCKMETSAFGKSSKGFEAGVVHAEDAVSISKLGIGARLLIKPVIQGEA